MLLAFPGLFTSDTYCARRRAGSIRLLARVPGTRFENYLVAEYILRHAWSQIWKLHLPGPTAISHEPTFLENTPGCTVLRMAERIQSCHTDPASHVGDCPERLRGIALPPGILRQDVAGDGLVRSFEPEARASEQPTVTARPDQVRASWPPLPLRCAELQKGLRVGNRLMPRPAHESGDIRIARVPFEDRRGIAGLRFQQHQPWRFYVDLCLHGADQDFCRVVQRVRLFDPCPERVVKRDPDATVGRISAQRVSDLLENVFALLLRKLLEERLEWGSDIDEPLPEIPW